MQTATYPTLPPVTDLTVIDADLIPTDNPFIKSIHVWYDAYGCPTSQSSFCGYDFLNWLRLIEKRDYTTLENYWYTVFPRERDRDVAKYLIYRNQLN